MQKDGGTLQLPVAGPSPRQYEFLDVGGNRALGGTLQLIRSADPFLPPCFDKRIYVIILISS